jgi:hypothetical protein
MARGDFPPHLGGGHPIGIRHGSAQACRITALFVDTAWQCSCRQASTDIMCHEESDRLTREVSDTVVTVVSSGSLRRS